MGKVGKLICGLLGIILLLGGILWTGIAVSCFTGNGMIYTDENGENIHYVSGGINEMEGKPAPEFANFFLIGGLLGILIGGFLVYTVTWKTASVERQRGITKKEQPLESVPAGGGEILRPPYLAFETPQQSKSSMSMEGIEGRFEEQITKVLRQRFVDGEILDEIYKDLTSKIEEYKKLKGEIEKEMKITSYDEMLRESRVRYADGKISEDTYKKLKNKIEKMRSLENEIRETEV